MYVYNYNQHDDPPQFFAQYSHYKTEFSAMSEYPLHILHIDPDILAVNKPSGLLTIRDGYNPLQPCLKEMLERDHGKVWVVHRLDKDTSGTILFARSAQTHRELNQQFEKHTVQKTYFALVHGSPCWQERFVQYPLRKDGDRSHRTVVDFRNGKPAITHISVLQKSAEHAWLGIQIRTGITHQIRAHLSAIGLPIVGDPLYAFYVQKTKDAPQLTAQTLHLHAFSLDFDHPTSTERTHIESLLPSYFQQSLKSL
jgi:RluA family pseudouridine synthase